MDKVLATKDGWVLERQTDTVTLDSHTFDGINGKVYRLMVRGKMASTELCTYAEILITCDQAGK